MKVPLIYSAASLPKFIAASTVDTPKSTITESVSPYITWYHTVNHFSWKRDQPDNFLRSLGIGMVIGPQMKKLYTKRKEKKKEKKISVCDV